jgi:hypothetical protein
MTLRRLNLRIQGFPESYANEPYGEDIMVMGESHPPMTVLGGVGGNNHRPQEMLTVSDDVPPATLPSHDPLGSPIRSSPLTEDPISGTA